MTDNQSKLEIAARNSRIEKELAAALSNKENYSDKNKARKKNTANSNTLYINDSEVISVSTSGSLSQKRGRGPKKPLDFAELADVTFVNDTTVVLATPFVVTCSICGGTKNVGYFKSANICLRCLENIKKTM